METLLTEVNWTAVIVGTFVAYGLGWLWYSDVCFGKKWREALGISVDDNTPMMHAMVAQLIGTFLLAWVIAVTAELMSLQLAALVTLAVVVLMKANSLFAQKGHYAIKVESGFVLVMVVAMVIVHAII